MQDGGLRWLPYRNHDVIPCHVTSSSYLPQNYSKEFKKFLVQWMPHINYSGCKRRGLAFYHIHLKVLIYAELNPSASNGRWPHNKVFD